MNSRKSPIKLRITPYTVSEAVTRIPGNYCAKWNRLLAFCGFFCLNLYAFLKFTRVHDGAKNSVFTHWSVSLCSGVTVWMKALFSGRSRPVWASLLALKVVWNRPLWIKEGGKQRRETDRRASFARLEPKLQHTACVVPMDMDDSALGGAPAAVQSLHENLAGDSTTSSSALPPPPPPHQTLSPRAREIIKTLDRWVEAKKHVSLLVRACVCGLGVRVFPTHTPT